jgi:two-component system NtrC family response regulator
MANVLIIDDNKLVNDSLAYVVQGNGHHPSSAFTLKEGMEKVRSGNFQVVFLDVIMPDGSGLELISDIKKASSSPEVIIITGFSEPKKAKKCLKEGAWDYVEKPLSPEQIKVLLIGALKHHQEKKPDRPK